MRARPGRAARVRGGDGRVGRDPAAPSLRRAARSCHAAGCLVSCGRVEHRPAQAHQRGSGRLSVETQHPRAWILCAKLVAHDVRPHAPRCTKFRDFFQEIVVRVKEERKTRRKDICV